MYHYYHDAAEGTIGQRILVNGLKTFSPFINTKHQTVSCKLHIAISKLSLQISSIKHKMHLELLNHSMQIVLKYLTPLIK